jgi:uncharacterized protein (DUF1697 family)
MSKSHAHVHDWLVFLRAVNVSGTGRLPMAELREALTTCGFENVKTYIQTGNILVSTPLSCEEVEAQVEDVLVQNFALQRAALAITPHELDVALDGDPFPQAIDTPQKIHILFLKKMTNFDADFFHNLCNNGEEFELKDQVLYLYTPNGAGRSKALAQYDKAFVAEAITARNLNSCMKIAALARA